MHGIVVPVLCKHGKLVHGAPPSVVRQTQLRPVYEELGKIFRVQLLPSQLGSLQVEFLHACLAQFAVHVSAYLAQGCAKTLDQIGGLVGIRISHHQVAFLRALYQSSDLAEDAFLKQFCVEKAQVASG